MNGQVFTTSMYAGSILLAIWVYVNIPRLRPATLGGAVAHIVGSFAAFQFVPYLFDAFAHILPAPLFALVAVAVVVVPALCYIYVSWLWLIGRIFQHLSRGPRGGKLVHARGG